MKFSTAGIECYLQRLETSQIAAVVPIAAVNPSNPTEITVGTATIGQFIVGGQAEINGISGTGWSILNGWHEITDVDSVNGMVSVDVDTSALDAPVFAGATISPEVVPVDIPVAGISAATNTKPVVLTVFDATEFIENDVVTITGTNTTLDNRSFIIDSINGNDVTLRGSDLSASTTIVTGGTMTGIPAGDMLRFCLSSYERAVEAADAIDVTTFCGAETLAGTPLPGTVSIEGYIDYSVDAYKEWLKAVADGQQRLFRITLPKGIGDIIMTITPSGVTETFEVNEAAAFSGEAVINQQPVYMV